MTLLYIYIYCPWIPQTYLIRLCCPALLPLRHGDALYRFLSSLVFISTVFFFFLLWKDEKVLNDKVFLFHTNFFRYKLHKVFGFVNLSFWYLIDLKFIIGIEFGDKDEDFWNSTKNNSRLNRQVGQNFSVFLPSHA